MGQDYAVRRAAKKAWKRQSSQNEKKLGDKGAQRKKPNAVRRMCKGMCYKNPSLDLEDLKWNGKLDNEGSDAEEASSAATQLTELSPVGAGLAHYCRWVAATQGQ
ncbi:ATP-dependent RNA helicase DED1, partial [Haematococcus lacustris]